MVRSKVPAVIIYTEVGIVTESLLC